MKPKFGKGVNSFKTEADKHRQKQPARSQAAREVTADEAEKFFAKMFTEFCKELPQLAAPGYKVRALEIHPDRAAAFGRRFVARHRVALMRRLSASN